MDNRSEVLIGGVDEMIWVSMLGETWRLEKESLSVGRGFDVAFITIVYVGKSIRGYRVEVSSLGLAFNCRPEHVIRFAVI